MKKDIHPDYHDVVFQDISTGESYITRSTVASDQTIDIEGKTYPLIRVEVSSSSHTFYTGKQNLIKTQGRVEKFLEKYGLE